MGHSPCPNPAGGGQGERGTDARPCRGEEQSKLEIFVSSFANKMSRDTARGPDGRLVEAVEWYQLIGPPA